jgi:two-component system, chemotaxis family, protein-glutamate methylesterase/glutaminase
MTNRSRSIPPEPADRDIIVIGGSAGGVEALASVVSAFPPDLGASVFAVIHFPPTSSSVLPQILRRAGRLSAQHPRDGEPVVRDRIYVAPPDHHMYLEDGTVRLSRGARENGVRPAADVLFRSAAAVYGPRVIAVVLSGSLDDGTAGAISVRRRGGLVLVQHPEDALFPGMPRSVLENDRPDFVLPLDELGPAIARLVRGSRDASIRQQSADQSESRVTAMEKIKELTGPPSSFVCPDCNGALWELRDGEHLRFQCHVGHAYSPDSMFSSQADALEHALWVALRSLKDRAALTRLLAERAAGRGQVALASRYTEQALVTEERAAVVRQVIERVPLADARNAGPRDDEVAITAGRERAEQAPREAEQSPERAEAQR